MNNILLVDGVNSFTRLYFEDGHIEYIGINILEYVKNLKVGSGYKRPISLNYNMLYPTSHSKDYECQYINIDYLDKSDKSFMNLLRNKNLYHKAIHMYMKTKEKYFLDGIG